MAGFIRFEEAPVKIGFGGLACDLLATTVTAGENLPLQAVRALGYNGAVAVTANGPIDGTWSVTYHLVKNAGVGSCTDTTSYSAGGCDNFFEPGEAGSTDFVLQRGSSAADFIHLSVGGGAAIFQKGMATTFTLSAEPNAIVTATLAGNFYDCGLAVAGAGMTAGTSKDGGGDLAVAHGSKVTATKGQVGFACDPFTATYEASRGLTPIYTLGKLDAIFVMVTDPQQSLSMQGENIANPVLKGGGAGTCPSTALCLDTADIDFAVKDVCDNPVATYEVCGFINSRDIEVAENDVLRGNVTVTDYTFKQKLTAVECSETGE